MLSGNKDGINELEKERLKQTIAIIDSILKDERIDLKKLFNNFIGDR